MLDGGKSVRPDSEGEDAMQGHILVWGMQRKIAGNNVTQIVEALRIRLGTWTLFCNFKGGTSAIF